MNGGMSAYALPADVAVGGSALPVLQSSLLLLNCRFPSEEPSGHKPLVIVKE